ncbi:MAG: hypothetical protein NTV39_01935 [Candidatus Saccharibacteria bacterium]|nr:hypothetical protein [Candidatus Saccharibacteria bacterium]
MPKEENEKPTEKSESVKAGQATDESVHEKPYNSRSSRPWIIAVVIILVILIFAIAGSMFRMNNLRQGYYNHGTTYVNGRGGMPHMNSSFFYSSSDSNGTTTTSTSAVSGVVTAVNGSSFDVGGGGTKTTVDTNGSTTWNTTDKKVSVNDSVLVYGTVSGSTITATSVQITNL